MHNLLHKHPVILLAAMLTLALLAYGFWPESIPVETAMVKRASLTVTIEEEGRSRVKDRYVISAPVDGVTCRVNMDVGDSVEQGQILLSITPLQPSVLDPRSYAQAKSRVAAAQAAVMAAEEKVIAATASANLASKELKRLHPLLEKGLISQETYDKAVTESGISAAAKRTADFNVDVARYELEAAQTLLNFQSNGNNNASNELVPIRSPITGKILKIHRKCEGPVKTGEALLEVGDPSALEIEVDVLSADAVRIKQGMPVIFERWGGEQPLNGIVRTIEPVGFTKTSALGVEEQRVLVISDITSPAEQWQSLGDGYRVEASFQLWQQDDILQVPASSLFRHQNNWAVFVVDQGQARLVHIEIGQRNGLAAQVIKGIKEGDLLVDHPSNEVEDGVRIRQR